MRTCRAHYPGGSERVHVSIASPFHAAFPETLGGSASALSFSRPAQASLALRPARSLNRPRRPLSRGFDGAGYPATPPVSYQLNRQLAGWNPPPQVFRAFEAHQRKRKLPHRRPHACKGLRACQHMFRFPDACYGWANRTLLAGVRKATRHEIAGSGHHGSRNLSTGYGI